MFDRPNQLVFYINVSLITFGILVALFSDFVIVGLLFALSALLLVFDQYRQNKFAFTISHLEKILAIHDTSGNKATLTQKQMISANHIGNSELWFKNIHSAGAVDNLKINGSPPAEQKNENGNLHVCLKFPPDLKVTEEFNVILSYDYKGIFTKPEEKLCHFVDTNTKLLRLVVELPKGRPITTARVFCKRDDVNEALLPPLVTGQTKIEAEIKNPLFGTEYCLQWNWPKQSVRKKLGNLF